MTSNEMFAKDQLNDLGNGEYTVTVGPNGEVLSINPDQDGRLETRPKGTTGPWERCRVQGHMLVFRPRGDGGRSWFVPFANDWPNHG